MKILVVADVEVFVHASLAVRTGAGDVQRRRNDDLIVFFDLALQIIVLLYYVPGNHDETFDLHSPEGCESIDGRLVEYRGVRILGLGGSYQYRPGSQQYTERQMASRIRRLTWTIRRHRGFDILVTHAPMRGVNDLDTPAHRGFECFSALIDRWQPIWFLHGHVHLNYGMNLPRKAERGQTQIVNAYEYTVIEI